MVHTTHLPNVTHMQSKHPLHLHTGMFCVHVHFLGTKPHMGMTSHPPPTPRYAIPASNYDRYNSQGYAAQGQQYNYAQYAT